VFTTRRRPPDRPAMSAGRAQDSCAREHVELTECGSVLRPLCGSLPTPRPASESPDTADNANALAMAPDADIGRSRAGPQRFNFGTTRMPEWFTPAGGYPLGRPAPRRGLAQLARPLHRDRQVPPVHPRVMIASSLHAMSVLRPGRWAGVSGEPCKGVAALPPGSGLSPTARGRSRGPRPRLGSGRRACG
jgi:hypothetical protein